VPPLQDVATSFSFRRKVSLKIETSEPVSTKATHGTPEIKMLTRLTDATEDVEAGAANVGFPKDGLGRDERRNAKLVPEIG